MDFEPKNENDFALQLETCKTSPSVPFVNRDEAVISKSEISVCLESSGDNRKGKNDELNLDCIISQGMKPLSECDISVDLNHKALRDFPIKLFSCGQNVQFLYLQGNLLETLPNNFFKTLSSLKRLDLRQNQLRSLPESVGDHQCLEVLLLQDNKLTSLPAQLGWAPRLRGLQLAGNPLEWPPQEVISKGINAVLSFLRNTTHHPSFSDQQIGNDGTVDIKRKEVGNITGNIFTDNAIHNVAKGDTQDVWKSASGNLITQRSLNMSGKGKEMLTVMGSNQHTVQQQTPIQESSQRKECRPLASTSSTRKTCIMHSTNNEKQHESKARRLCEKLEMQEPFQKVELSHRRGRMQKPMKKYMSPDYALAFVRGRPFPLGYRKRTSHDEASRTFKSLMNKIWTNQLKCILLAQDNILQKRKNREALSKWRKEARQLQAVAPVCNWKGLMTPFDLQCENPTMLSRWELQQNKSLEKRGHSKPNALSTRAPGRYEKIVQLMTELNKAQSSHAEVNLNGSGLETAAYRRQLSAEINKIQELQKAIQAFHLSF